MAHRSGWRRLVLVLMLMLVSLPAMAGERPSGRRGEGSGFAAVWRAVVRWVAACGVAGEAGAGDGSGWRHGWDGSARRLGVLGRQRGDELGPEMDPNG